MSAGGSTSTSSDELPVLIALPAPPRHVQRQVARVLVDILARRALVDVGVVASNDSEIPE